MTFRHAMQAAYHAGVEYVYESEGQATIPIHEYRKDWPGMDFEFSPDSAEIHRITDKPGVYEPILYCE